MKYIKWNLVDSQTKEHTNGVITPNGLSHPAVAGLDAKLVHGNTYFGVCDTDATLDPKSKITQLTLTQLNSELAVIFADRKNQMLARVWAIAKDKREQYTGREYHPTEISAGSGKYKEALAAVAAPTLIDAQTAAPGLALEASTRNMSLITLANKVIDKYNSFVQLEALIAGYSGKLGDQINALTFINANSFSNFELFNSINIESGWPA